MKADSSRGVSLVAAVVAMAVLSVALAMAASSLAGASRLARQAADFAVAADFASGVMERTLASPFDGLESHTLSDPVPGLANAVCRVAVVPRDSGVKQVTVTCTWTDSKRTRRVEFSTLRVRGQVR